jgi:hypothetical protein
MNVGWPSEVHQFMIQKLRWGKTYVDVSVFLCRLKCICRSRIEKYAFFYFVHYSIYSYCKFIMKNMIQKWFSLTFAFLWQFSMQYHLCLRNEFRPIDMAGIICISEDFLMFKNIFSVKKWYDELCFKLNRKLWEDLPSYFPLMWPMPHRKWCIWCFIVMHVFVATGTQLTSHCLAVLGQYICYRHTDGKVIS